MAKGYKYYHNDMVYKDDAFRALSAQFGDDFQNFESFYSSLNDSETKDEFLRVSSSYLFFVKNGEWHVNVSRSNNVIEYFTNSFKLVALLAIIAAIPVLDSGSISEMILCPRKAYCGLLSRP